MLKRILVGLISICLLTGCSPKDFAEEIVFYSWGSVSEVKIIQNIISEFEKENSDIKIKFLHTPQNYFQKLHLLFASKTAPDVIFINNLYLPLYAEQLLDLTDEINTEGFYEESIEALSFNDKLYAVPRDVSNLVLYINTDKIPLPNQNWTLENLLEIAKKSTYKETWGIGFEEDIYWALPYLSYYGEVFDEDFLPDKSEGLCFYIELRDKYKVAPTKSQIGSSTLAQMFLDQKIVMYLSGRWMYPKISESANFNWAVASFPYGKNPLPCDASGWAVSKNTKHKEASLKFVRFLSSKKGLEMFTETGLIVPARIGVSKKINNSIHNERVFLDVINKSKKTKITKNYKKLIDKFNAEF